MARTWLVTGASRGLGGALVARLLAQGENVVAITRSSPTAVAGLAPSVEADGRFLHMELDICSPAATALAATEVGQRYGAIDILVNCAGASLIGAVEECTPEAVEQVFQVNVFGLLNMIRAVLPIMRAQRSGHILNFSSIAVLDASAGSSTYAASKSAVEAISESLYKELAPLGIHVTIVQPGHFDTGFLQHSTAMADTEIADYAATAGLTRGAIRAYGSTASEPGLLADAILVIVGSPGPPLRFLAGKDALDRFERTHDKRNPDIDQWRELSSSLVRTS